MKTLNLCAAALALLLYLPAAEAACIDDEGRWRLDCEATAQVWSNCADVSPSWRSER